MFGALIQYVSWYFSLHCIILYCQFIVFNNIEYNFYLIILVYSFYCQFFEPVTNTVKNNAFIRKYKISQNKWIHIQNICLCVKADESCQAKWKMYSIFRVASSGVVYDTQTWMHFQNKSWDILIQNILLDVYNSQVCWVVVHVIQSTWDFWPEVLDRFQIRWHRRPIHVLQILIFEEIHDASRSVCWNIVILKQKHLPRSLSYQMEPFWFPGYICTGTDPSFHPVHGAQTYLFYGRYPLSWLRRHLHLL